MKKITYEEKITTLNRYIEQPQNINDPEVLRAVKVDVIKAHSKGVKTAKELHTDGAEGTLDSTKTSTENALYNSAMGVYREFVVTRGSFLDMSGRKARMNSDAMREILKFIRDFAASNGKPNDDAHVLEALKFMFTHWDRLNDWLKGQIMLPQINKHKQEILLKIRNGADKKSATKDDLNSFKESLRRGQ